MIIVVAYLIYIDAGQAGSQKISAAGNYSLGSRTKFSLCTAYGPYPDFACTSGDGIDVPLADLCRKGYTQTVRNVSEETKRAVYQEYGIGTHHAGEYEIDHLVPLELGGTNSIANLWPEPANPTPGFHEKDSIENLLHEKVCSGEMTLAQAQYDISHNWTRYLG